MFTWSSEEYCSRSFIGSGPSFLLNNLFYLTIVEEMVEKTVFIWLFPPISSSLWSITKLWAFFPICVCALSWAWVNEDYPALIPFTVTSFPELKHRLINQNMNSDTTFLSYPNLLKVLKALKHCLYTAVCNIIALHNAWTTEWKWIYSLLCMLLFFVCRSSSVFRPALGPVAFPLIL